jgi:hypothetical protein
MFMIRKANEEYTCVLCNHYIKMGNEYIRPLHTGLNRVVVNFRGSKITWSDRRPFFHVECFRVLRRWFNSTVPVINSRRQRVI